MIFFIQVKSKLLTNGHITMTTTTAKDKSDSCFSSAGHLGDDALFLLLP